MKLINFALAALVVVIGSGLAYYFATVEMPVAAGEHDESGHGGDHAEKGHSSEEQDISGDHTEHGDDDDDEHGHDEDDGHGHDEDDGHGHDENDDHGGDEDEEHAHGSDEHAEEDGAQHAKIDDASAEKHGIKLSSAASGMLQNALTLPGEIALDANRVVHVVPRLKGVATQVLKNLGDTVSKGETIAIIDSRELADVKSDYLAAIERRSLAQSRYSREKELFDKKISPAEDYLSAKQALAEEEINIRSGEQKLQALGLTPENIADVRNRRDKTLTDYTLVSPIDGTVIEKHLNTGEFVDEQADAFVIADLSQVWVSVVVFAADLKNVRDGQQVVVRSEDLALEATGEVAYIGALVGEQTRTAKATVELPNPEGSWRPGLFVSVAMAQDEILVPLAVPADAVQTLNEETVVFVREGADLEARPVNVGRSDGKHVEILDGLRAGEMYVSENSFLVKADIEKAGAAHEH